MRYRFPSSQFVKTNSPENQVQHILSEAKELYESIQMDEPVARQIEEALDLIHSVETLLRGYEHTRTAGPGDIHDQLEHVIQKNHRRGYYQ